MVAGRRRRHARVASFATLKPYSGRSLAAQSGPSSRPGTRAAYARGTSPSSRAISCSLSRAFLPRPRVLHRPGVLRAVRRGDVVPLVPGGSGAARPVLRDLFLRLGPQGHGHARHPRGHRPQGVAELIGVVGGELQRLAEKGPTRRRSPVPRLSSKAGLLMSLEKLLGPRRADGAPVDPVWAAHFHRGADPEGGGSHRYPHLGVRRPLAAGRPSIAVVGAGRRARRSPTVSSV